MDKVEVFVFIGIGVFIGSVVMGIAKVDKMTLADHATAIINECQASLPRDTTCELTSRVLK